MIQYNGLGSRCLNDFYSKKVILPKCVLVSSFKDEEDFEDMFFFSAVCDPGNQFWRRNFTRSTFPQMEWNTRVKKEREIKQSKAQCTPLVTAEFSISLICLWGRNHVVSCKVQYSSRCTPDQTKCRLNPSITNVSSFRVDKERLAASRVIRGLTNRLPHSPVSFLFSWDRHQLTNRLCNVFLAEPNLYFIYTLVYTTPPRCRRALAIWSVRSQLYYGYNCISGAVFTLHRWCFKSMQGGLNSFCKNIPHAQMRTKILHAQQSDNNGFESYIV